MLTKLEQLINPEVMADIISAELPNALRATGFMKVDSTLTGRAGNTITIPRYGYIGAATDLAEGETSTDIAQLTTTDEEYTVKKAVKNVQLTDEAVLSGYGDPVGEATKQLKMSIKDKVDDDGVLLLEGIKESTAGALYYKDTATALSYAFLVEALDMLPTEEQGEDLYLLVNKKGIKQLRLDPRFIENTALGDKTVSTATVGMIAGCKVVISEKIKDNLSGGIGYIMRPNSLTVFLKRDTAVERERNVLNKTTLISVDKHYVVAIEDLSKIVKLEYKSA